jgi:hypothetical protein
VTGFIDGCSFVGPTPPRPWLAAPMAADGGTCASSCAYASTAPGRTAPQLRLLPRLLSARPTTQAGGSHSLLLEHPPRILDQVVEATVVTHTAPQVVVLVVRQHLLALPQRL